MKNKYIPQYPSCGSGSGTTISRYVEILAFKHFAKIMTFNRDEQDYRNKAIIDRISVSVVIDVFNGNMFNTQK